MISKDYAAGDETRMDTGDFQWHIPFVPDLVEAGDAITIWDDDSPSLIIGVVPMWEGVAEGWTVFNGENTIPTIRLIKTVKWWMDNYCTELGIRRLETSVASERQYKWSRLIGFEPEYVKPEGAPDGSNMVGMVKWYRRLH